MRVVVTHIWGNGTVVTRMVDVDALDGVQGRNSRRVPWLTRLPYRAFPAGAGCQIRVDDQAVMVAERDLTGPLLDLVAALLVQVEVK
jgi:hypothetical protein